MKFFTSWKFVPVHLLLAILFSFAIILYFFKVYLPEETLHGEEITVPNLINRDTEEVTDILEKKQLRFVIQDTTYSENHKANAVVNQVPLPNEFVKKDRKIYLTINSASPPPVLLTEEDINEICRMGVSDLKKNLSLLKLKKGRKIADTIIRNFDGVGFIYSLHYKNKKLEGGEEIPRWADINYRLVRSGGYVAPDSSVLDQDTSLDELKLLE